MDESDPFSAMVNAGKPPSLGEEAGEGGPNHVPLPDTSPQKPPETDSDPFLAMANPLQHSVPKMLTRRLQQQVPWEHVKPELEQLGVQAEPLRQGYQLDTARAVQKGEGVSTHEQIVRNLLPFGSQLHNRSEAVAYTDALARYKAGTATEQDAGTIARNERLQDIDKKIGSTFGGKVLQATMGFPALIGEAGVAGKVVGGLGRAVGIGGQVAAEAGLGARVAANVAPRVAAAPLIPSLYQQQAAQQNISEGRAADDIRGYVPAVAYAALANTVLGQVQGAVGGTGSIGRKILKAGAIGAAEQQGADTIAGAVDLVLPKAYQTDTRFGTVGHFLRGEAGEGLQHLAVQALTFAAFGAAHATPGERPTTTHPVVQAMADALNSEAKAGVPAPVAAKRVQTVFDRFHQLLAEDPANAMDRAKEEWKAAKDQPMANLAEALTQVMPKKPVSKPATPAAKPEAVAATPEQATTPASALPASTPNQPSQIETPQPTPIPPQKTVHPIDTLTKEQGNELASALGTTVKKIKADPNSAKWVAQMVDLYRGVAPAAAPRPEVAPERPPTPAEPPTSPAANTEVTPPAQIETPAAAPKPDLIGRMRARQAARGDIKSPGPDVLAAAEAINEPERGYPGEDQLLTQSSLRGAMDAAKLTGPERHVLQERLRPDDYRSLRDIADDVQIRKPNGQPWSHEQISLFEQAALKKLGKISGGRFGGSIDALRKSAGMTELAARYGGEVAADELRHGEDTPTQKRNREKWEVEHEAAVREFLKQHPDEMPIPDHSKNDPTVKREAAELAAELRNPAPGSPKGIALTEAQIERQQRKLSQEMNDAISEISRRTGRVATSVRAEAESHVRDVTEAVAAATAAEANEGRGERDQAAPAVRGETAGDGLSQVEWKAKVAELNRVRLAEKKRQDDARRLANLEKARKARSPDGPQPKAGESEYVFQNRLRREAGALTLADEVQKRGGLHAPSMEGLGQDVTALKQGPLKHLVSTKTGLNDVTTRELFSEHGIRAPESGHDADHLVHLLENHHLLDPGEWDTRQVEKHAEMQDEIARAEAEAHRAGFTPAQAREAVRAGVEAGEASGRHAEPGGEESATGAEHGDAFEDAPHGGREPDTSFDAAAFEPGASHAPGATVGGPGHGGGVTAARPAHGLTPREVQERVVDDFFSGDKWRSSAQPFDPNAPTSAPTVRGHLTAAAHQVGEAAREAAVAAYHHVREAVIGAQNNLRELAGQMFPRTARLAATSADAISKFVAAHEYVSRIVPELLDKVLPKGKTAADTLAIGRKFMAALYEMRFRFAKSALERKAAELKAEASRQVDPEVGRKLANEAYEYDGKAAEVKTMVGRPNAEMDREQDYQATIKDPEFQQFLDRWRQHIVPLNERFYKMAEGLEDHEDIDSLTQIPGLAFHAKAIRKGDTVTDSTVVPTGKGDPTNPRQRQLGAARQFTGAASLGYDIDPAAVIENSLRKSVSLARKAEAYRVMVKDGVTKWGNAGERPAGDEWADAKLIKEVNPPPGTQEAQQGQTALWVKPQAEGEVRQALDVDRPFRHLPGSTTASTIALFAIVEGATHLKNLSTMNFKPGMYPTDLARNFWGVLKSRPDAMQRIIDLAEIGATKPKGLEQGGTLRKLNPARYMAKALDVFDSTMRLTAEDAFNRLVRQGRAEGSEGNKRNFINQLGQYNRRAQNTIVAWLRDTGLGPFATAGTNYTMQGLRALTFNPGVTATSTRAAIGMRAEVALRMAAVLAIAPLVNYLKWGRVDGDDNTPLGGVKVSDGNGKTGYIDLAALTGLPRGARSIGLLALAEGARTGATAGQIGDRARKDVTGALMHPAEGPAVQTVHMAVTGENAVGVPVARHAKEGNSQALEDLRAAILNVNPVVAGLTGANRTPGDQASTTEKIMGLLGPLGIKYRKSPPGKPLPPKR